MGNCCGCLYDVDEGDYDKHEDKKPLNPSKKKKKKKDKKKKKEKKNQGFC